MSKKYHLVKKQSAEKWSDLPISTSLPFLKEDFQTDPPDIVTVTTSGE